ncbi:MAG: amidase family protein [Hyphomonadaceae bacterium]
MTASNELSFASATALTAALRKKAVSALELCDAAIARIEALDGSINAVIVRDFERARADARRADDALGRGETRPLLGVPMTVKESFDLRGYPSTWGMTENREHRAAEPALAVQRLKTAGAVVLGKTNVPPMLADWQSDNPVYGRTNNPWNLERSPGGSSGGSAAAVAMGFSALEIGTDIGGSVRVPAAFCGVYGLKSSYGVIPLTGHSAGGAVIAPAPLSVAGPLARSAEDLALLMKVTAGPEADSPATALEFPGPRHETLSSFRVFVIDHLPTCRADSEILHALNETADRLSREGASISRASSLLPDLVAAHRMYVKMLTAVTTRRQPGGRAPISAHDYFDLLDEQLVLRRQWAEFFRHFDIILAPAFGTVAFPHAFEPDWRKRSLTIDGEPTPFGAQLGWISIATGANLPAAVAPVGLSRDGMPIALQVIAPWLGDLQAAHFAGLIGRPLPPPPAAQAG